jgi:hypothetical protein
LIIVQEGTDGQPQGIYMDAGSTQPEEEPEDDDDDLKPK